MKKLNHLKPFNEEINIPFSDEDKAEVSVNFFDDRLNSSQDELYAAAMTLRYLSGFFSKHIQANNIKKSADVVFDLYKSSKRHLKK